METPTDTIAELSAIAEKYGWQAKHEAGENYYFLNRKQLKVLSLSMRGNKYTFSDTTGAKLLSGNKSPANGLETLLTTYYYCKPIIQTKSKP